MKLRTAPFSASEVEALNRLQQHPEDFVFSPCDCPGCLSAMTATANGMVCGKCGYHQIAIPQSALDIALSGPRQLTIWNL